MWFNLTMLENFKAVAQEKCGLAPDKTVLVGVSGGRAGALNALDGLRSIGRGLHAWVIPKQVSIPEAWKAFHADGSLNDQELENRLLEVGQQVARFAYLHTSETAMDFLRLWETAPQNPGGAGG